MTKTKILNHCIAAVLFASSFAGSAMAAQMVQATMRIIGHANTPIGAYDFCRDNEPVCDAVYPDTGPVVLTEAKWKEILNVNYQVNSSVQPMTDLEVYGVEEKWAYPKTVGDCEDFALLKQRMLQDAGISPSALLVTVVLQPSGEGHAVLTVRTDRGDFILDNMRDKVLLWKDTEYSYLKRQSATSYASWDKIQDGRAPVVGSVTQ